MLFPLFVVNWSCYLPCIQQPALAGRKPLLPRPAAAAGVEYRFLTEFQSHEPEFDYLKSLEIEEKINKVKFCKRMNGSLMMLSTNGNIRTSPFLLFLYLTLFLQTKLSSYGRYRRSDCETSLA